MALLIAQFHATSLFYGEGKACCIPSAYTNKATNSGRILIRDYIESLKQKGCKTISNKSEVTFESLENDSVYEIDPFVKSQSKIYLSSREAILNFKYIYITCF